MALFSDDQLIQAYLNAGLGAEEHYPVWTALWGVRSRIWQDKKLRKLARHTTGKLAHGAIEDGNAALFQLFADALAAMVLFERSSRNALKADVFFAINELNAIKGRFTRRHLLKWLNKTLEAPVSDEELHAILKEMDLLSAIPG